MTDIFYYHGYTELWLGGCWIKATPAFNIGLCERFGVKALEFDGREHALMHEFDTAGRRHMQYLTDHGSRDDLPYAELAAAYQKHYPRLLAAPDALSGDMAAQTAWRAMILSLWRGSLASRCPTAAISGCRC